MQSKIIAVLIAVCGAYPACAVNLLRNGGFEHVPSNATGQGLLPSEWYSHQSTPDTYSNDGSYGLNPGDFGNFPGVTAHGGIRWVAGWSDAVEEIGQVLTSSLTAGQSYTISAYLHQAVRGDLDNPGAYQIRFEDATASNSFVAGTWSPTVSVSEGWVFRSLTFVAPNNSALLDRIVFSPTGSSAYPGMDDVSLAPVPEPVTFGLACSALGLAWRRRPRAS